MIDIEHKRLHIEPEAFRQNLPKQPGVYLFRDEEERVIYVGKAKNLRNRVLSYLKPASELTRKTAMMVSRAKSLDYIITTTENEAFILENTLIKKHRPRYNIVLIDDKQYPFLRLGINEQYPRLALVRKIKKDGALYFGPYSSALSVRSTLRLINRIFRIRKCRQNPVPVRSRPCLNYELGRCLGPCARNVSSGDYMNEVEKVKLFLEGRNRELVKELETEMMRLAENEKFEEAAIARDQIRSIEKTVEKQNIVSSDLKDQDVIGAAQKEGVFVLVILFVRKGAITGSRDYWFENNDEPVSCVMEAFLKQYYARDRYIPKDILISEPVDELPQIMDWLSEIAGKRVSVRFPLRGRKRGVVEIAVANALDLISRKRETDQDALLGMVKSSLGLKKVPRRIEGLDISTFQGSQSVGTLVSFVDGVPDKSGYRNYRIKTIEGVDDYGMMSEMVSRRLGAGDPPDLFLVDGGKGHLRAVERTLGEFSEAGVPELAAIAKQREESPEMDRIFIPGRRNPLNLKKGHPVLLLLMRIRDETHRRAVGYHRKLRSLNLKTSVLDQVHGIGEKKKISLLKRFGSVEAIAVADVEDLVQVKGIDRPLAERLLSFLSAL